jgi:hypothetical protein
MSEVFVLTPTPAPPLQLTEWDPHRTRIVGVSPAPDPFPGDWWKYEVWINGVREPDAVRADTKRGVVTVLDKRVEVRDLATGETRQEQGQAYHVAGGKTLQRTGQVVIRLKPRWEQFHGT